ncbi:hypothetical protein BKA93DRAFT_770079 [Sparassis latifolia]
MRTTATSSRTCSERRARLQSPQASTRPTSTASNIYFVQNGLSTGCGRLEGGMTRAGADVWWEGCACVQMGEYGGLSASLWESCGERTTMGRVRLRRAGDILLVCERRACRPRSRRNDREASADRGGQAADSAREGWAFDVMVGRVRLRCASNVFVIRECHACRPKPKEEQLRRECRQRRAEDGQRAQ